MRVASIDVGSNTVLLLIADTDDKKSFATVLNEYRAPRLSRGLSENGFISNDSMNSFYKILAEYKKIIDDYKCDKVIVKATQAMRKAANSDAIIKHAAENFDFQIEIISGAEEALLSYLGAISKFDDFENYCVIDIGGASTEVIIGEKKSIRFRKSFPFGAVYLTEKYIRNDSYSKTDLRKINEYLFENFQELEDRNILNAAVIAVAGTPTTLSAINMGLKEYDENSIEGSCLSLNAIENLTEHLKTHSPGELLEIHAGIIKGREDILLAGTLILKNFMKILKKDIIYVSGRGLRYGILIDYINSLY